MSDSSPCECAVIIPTISLETLLAAPVKIEGRLISDSRMLGECHSAVTLAMAHSERNDE